MFITDETANETLTAIHRPRPGGGGLSRDLVTQLVLKTLHLSGELTGTDLAAPGLAVFRVIEPASTISNSSTS